jgi:hypothetical protein
MNPGPTECAAGLLHNHPQSLIYVPETSLPDLENEGIGLFLCGIFFVCSSLRSPLYRLSGTLSDFLALVILLSYSHMLASQQHLVSAIHTNNG